MATPGEMQVAQRAMLALRLELRAAGQIANAVAAGGVSLLTVGLRRLTSVITAPILAIKQLGDYVSQFVMLANPGAVKLFNYALNNTLSVIGELLTPVLRGATAYIQEFGKILAQLRPVLQPIFDALGNFLRGSVVGAVGFLEAAAPFIEAIADAIVGLIKNLGIGLALLQGYFIEGWRTVAALLGLKSTRFDKNAQSPLAFRQARTDSVEGFSKALFEKSLINLAGGQEKKGEVDYLKEIQLAIAVGQQVVVDIKNTVVEIFEFFQNKKKQVEDFVGGAGDAAGGALESGISGIAGLLGKMFVR